MLAPWIVNHNVEPPNALPPRRPSSRKPHIAHVADAIWPLSGPALRISSRSAAGPSSLRLAIGTGGAAQRELGARWNPNCSCTTGYNRNFILNAGTNISIGRLQLDGCRTGKTRHAQVWRIWPVNATTQTESDDMARRDGAARRRSHQSARTPPPHILSRISDGGQLDYFAALSRSSASRACKSPGEDPLAAFAAWL